MANVRDSDTSLWLHNKLGTSNDSWTTGSICTQLNAEVLKNIKDCFPDLQTQVKLKLLLSFFHIPRRNVEEWKSELEEIIEVAGVDSDLWVAMLAEVLKTFPSAGTLNTEIAEFDETRPIFSDMIGELRRALAKHDDLGLLPLECLYLNKNALVSVVGQQPAAVKHFTLKRKPKSVALRSELLAKATEVAANQKKAQAPTVPVRSRGMPRKMTDTTPLKGLPSLRGRVGPGRVAPPAPPPRPPRAGIKLLDITEQPATHAQIKKRRKLELEEGKKSVAVAPPSPPQAEFPKLIVSSAVPLPKTEDSQSTSVSSMDVSVRSPPPLCALQSAPAPPATPAPPAEEQVVPASAPTSTPDRPRPIIIQQGTGAKPIVINQQPKLLLAGQSGGKPVLLSANNIISSSAVILQPGGKLAFLQNIKPVPQNTIQQTQGRIQSIQPPPLHQHIGQTVQLATNVQQPTVVQHTVQHLPTSVQPVQVQQAVQPQNQPQGLLPRRGLSLTREQMLEAQDMFRNANRVTRPEKALILGFMAGSRDNPCPNLGNIVTIKLSENFENVVQSDDTYIQMVSEMHFQMNYNNGQWTRLKKYKPIDGAVPLKIPPNMTVVATANQQPIVSLSTMNQGVS